MRVTSARNQLLSLDKAPFAKNFRLRLISKKKCRLLFSTTTKKLNPRTFACSRSELAHLWESQLTSNQQNVQLEVVGKIDALRCTQEERDAVTKELPLQDVKIRFGRRIWCDLLLCSISSKSLRKTRIFVLHREKIGCLQQPIVL